jgi:molecular chaperone DnaK
VLAAHLLEDVSVEVSGGKTALLVPYGTRLPVTVSDKFSTVDDGQPSVELHLVTGIATPLRKTIARINSKLLLDQPRRVPTVAMTLTIDERGELEVELREVGSESVVRRHGFSVPVSTPGRKPDQVN